MKDLESTDCEAWIVDYAECHTHDDTPENEYVTCMAERTLESPYSVFSLKEGASYQWYVGFNVFENHSSDVRVKSAVSDPMDILMAE